jgi:phosphoribosyl 1,2-cyclic phosphodiesterase
MKIKIWGCRGSIVSPGENTVRYGGNTTCVEVRNHDGRLIILDAGSGLRNLGKTLAGETNSTWQMLLTHAHWDHLCGFPFFGPMYDPRCRLTICGGPAAQQSLQRYFKHQMEPPFFPVPFEGLRARVEFGCRCDHACAGDIMKHGGPGCRAIPLSHPDGGYGFKLEDEGRVLVFLPDNELSFHHPNAASFAEYVEFCRGADLLLHDAQYTDAEYARTRGWGHSTYSDAVRLAHAAGVIRLGLFHHDPDRTDDDLDRQVEWCRQQLRDAGSTVDCFACAEEMTIEL